MKKGQNRVNFTLPEALPSGQYLVRVESIGLHEAQTAGAAQFYLSCGQIEVTGGGSGIPEPLVAFPGAYQPTDPGILIDIWDPSVSCVLRLAFLMISGRDLRTENDRQHPTALLDLRFGKDIR